MRSMFLRVVDRAVERSIIWDDARLKQLEGRVQRLEETINANTKYWQLPQARINWRDDGVTNNTGRD